MGGDKRGTPSATPRLVGDRKSVGGRSLLGVGSVMQIAAKQVVVKGLALAAKDLEAAAADIEFANGAYRIKGTDRAVTLLALATKYAGTPLALDVKSYRSMEGVVQIHGFSDPPAPGDCDALVIPDQDIDAIRKCRSGDCVVKITDDMLTLELPNMPAFALLAPLDTDRLADRLLQIVAAELGGRDDQVGPAAQRLHQFALGRNPACHRKILGQRMAATGLVVAPLEFGPGAIEDQRGDFQIGSPG